MGDRPGDQELFLGGLAAEATEHEVKSLVEGVLGPMGVDWSGWKWNQRPGKLSCAFFRAAEGACRSATEALHGLEYRGQFIACKLRDGPAGAKGKGKGKGPELGRPAPGGLYGGQGYGPAPTVRAPPPGPYGGRPAFGHA